jgi:hypothetical protein
MATQRWRYRYSVLNYLIARPKPPASNVRIALRQQVIESRPVHFRSTAKHRLAPSPVRTVASARCPDGRVAKQSDCDVKAASVHHSRTQSCTCWQCCFDVRFACTFPVTVLLHQYAGFTGRRLTIFLSLYGCFAFAFG